MYNTELELYHHGVLGMKWGHRKKNYNSTSVRAAIARRENNKIDNSFKKWKQNSQKRDDSIELGKKRNLAKLAYESDKSNKKLKVDYKVANRDYKKSLRKNTTYRKGVVRQEVGSDLSRKYMSAAKNVKQQMVSGTNDKKMQKQYSYLMSQHDIERAKARRAANVGAARSKKKAAIKRKMTMSLKATVSTATLVGGTYAANKFLQTTNMNIAFNPDSEKFKRFMKVGKQMLNLNRMMY